jgi:hypothetical protein
MMGVEILVVGGYKRPPGYMCNLDINTAQYWLVMFLLLGFISHARSKNMNAILVGSMCRLPSLYW